MSRRLIVLFAAVALLMIAAVPVSAAPGGVPGPPPGHDKAKEKVAVDGEEVADGEDDTKGPPSWANAYGMRIKNEFGMPFGHLQQCAGIADESQESDGEPKKALEACPENLEFPEDANGAKAFWVFTEPGLMILGL